MPRSPLTEKFLRIVALRDEVKTWPQDEQDFFLDMLAPEPEPRRATKKANKKSSTSKSSQSSTKSPRASGMAAQLKSRVSEQRETAKDDNYDPESERCTFQRDDGRACFLLPDHNVHHMKTHPKYHEFESGKSTAPPAPAPSPANGGVESTTVNSKTGKETALAAGGNASE